MNPFPAVVFLDLKMRGIAGGDILNSVSALSTQDHAKIFVHSELGNVSELQRIYSLGADSFLSKPLKETDLFNLLYHFPAPFEIQPPSH